MRINLIGSQEKGLSVSINNQRSENCYVVPSPKGRGGIAQVGSPGTASFCTGVSGVPRGAIKADEVAYFVHGTALYVVNSLGIETSLGTIPGSGRVSLAFDGASIICVNGTTTGYYYNVDTATFSSVSLPYTAHTVAMLDTYAVFTSTDDIFFISNVGDTDAFDSLNFERINKSPDTIQAVIEDHGELFLFGKEHGEPWSNTAGVDFPFSLNSAGLIERGLYSRWAIAKEDNTVIFLGDDLIVYRLEGYTPIRISDQSTEIQLNELKDAGYTADLENAFAFIYTDHGHKFFQLTVPNRLTVVYDVATQQWHNKKHFNYETHIAGAHVDCYGKHLLGGIDGNVYEMSRSYYDDAGEPLKRLRRSHVFHNEDRILKWKEIKLFFETGTTPLTEGQGSAPVAVLRWSDDGRVFGNEKFLSLGAMGEYNKRVVKRHCGSARARTVEFYVTDPVPFVLLDAYAIIS